jgi:DNA-binding NtrC family response regulator
VNPEGVFYCSLEGVPSPAIIEKLQVADLGCRTARSLAETRDALLLHTYQVLVIRSGSVCDELQEMIHFIAEHRLPTKVIISVGAGRVEDAVSLIRGGAIDFLVGDSSDARIVESILKTATHYREPSAGKPDQVSEISGPDAVLIGMSPSICEIRSAVSLVAKSQTTVLITGESGTVCYRRVNGYVRANFG